MSLIQQKAVYQAQTEVFPYWGRIFKSLQDVEKYLSDIMNTEWFFQMFGPTKAIEIVEWNDKNRWSGAADIENSRILLKPASWGFSQECIVIHELAHILCGSGDHDGCFVRTQLKLLRQTMGFQCYAEYKHSLLSTGAFQDYELQTS